MTERAADSDFVALEPGHFSMAEYIGRIGNDLAKAGPSDLPDFLVLSPPRTATTWLARALSAHRGIFIPPEKEVRYFDVGWRFSDLAYYRDRYAGADGRLKGDASPSYVLLPSDVIGLLHRAKPAMKFIVLVRDLESRAWSNFRHSYSVGEFGLHSGATFDNLVPDEKVLNYLVSDYSLSVGDYREYLGRWLEYFQAGQFFIAGVDEAGRDPVDLVRRLYGFLGAEEAVDVALDVSQRANTGFGGIARTANIDRLLTALYGVRQQHQDAFLQETFGFRFRDPAVPKGAALPLVELVTRADAFKVFVWNGKFHACALEQFSSVRAALTSSPSSEGSHIVADYYSDLVSRIDQHKRGTAHRLNKKEREDARLLAVINALADDYVASNSLRTNLNAVRILRAHRGFNVVAVGFGGAVIAIRQTVGPVQIGGADLNGLVEKHGAENVIIRWSLADAIRSVDLLIEKGGAAKEIADFPADSIERIEKFHSGAELQFQELRARNEALAGEVTSMGAQILRDLEGAARREADALAALGTRLEGRQDVAASRLEGELQSTQKRVEEELTEIRFRMKQDQDALVQFVTRMENGFSEVSRRAEELWAQMGDRVAREMLEAASRSAARMSEIETMLSQHHASLDARLSASMTDFEKGMRDTVQRCDEKADQVARTAELGLQLQQQQAAADVANVAGHLKDLRERFDASQSTILKGQQELGRCLDELRAENARMALNPFVRLGKSIQRVFRKS